MALENKILILASLWLVFLGVGDEDWEELTDREEDTAFLTSSEVLMLLSPGLM